MTKPVWVQMVQIMAAISAVPALFMLGTFLYMIAMPGFDREVAGYCVMDTFLILCAVLAIVGCERQRRYGRQAGPLLQCAAIVQACVFCFGVIHKRREYPDDIPVPEEDIETVIMAVVGSVVAVVLGGGLGFLRQSRAWFGLEAPSSST